MLRPYIDGESGLSVGPGRRQGVRAAARPRARGRRLGRGARRAARPACDARADAAARAARAGGAPRRPVGRADAAPGARPRRGARHARGGRRHSVRGVRGGRRRRRPTRHLQGGRPGPGLQYLPGRADPPVRGPRAATQGARLPRGRAALPGRRRAARGSPQAAQPARAAPRGHAHGHPRVGGWQARRHRGRGHRGAAGRGPRDHVASGDREGPRRGVHHRSGREGRADDHRAQHGATAHVAGEARARDGSPGNGEGVMVESPLPALRSEYEEIARRLETVTGGAEREAVKREIIAYFKQVDALIGELSALKEEVRKLVGRFKQVAGAPEEASAPEFTGTRPVVHADHIGASTFNEKGWSLISLGDYAGAIQALQRALQLSPGETQAESLLGWGQMLHEDYDDALATFQKVLMKEPANSLARINVGYICLKKKIFGEAIEHLSKAIRLDNDKKATLYAHFYLGLVYLQREMFEDAETFFQKTLKLGPNLIEAYYELGRAHWFAGDQAKAKSTWDEGF